MRVSPSAVALLINIKESEDKEIVGIEILEASAWIGLGVQRSSNVAQ